MRKILLLMLSVLLFTALYPRIHPYLFSPPVQVIEKVPDKEAVLALNPFEESTSVAAGIETVSQVDNQLPLADKSEKQYTFSLIGVLFDTDNPKALIAVNEQYEWLFAPGDELINGWYVHEIQKQQVELRNGDQQQFLRMVSVIDVSAELTYADEAYIDPAEKRRLQVLKRLDSPEFFTKVLKYLDGRHPTEAEFPVGVDSYGIYPGEEGVIEIRRQEIVDQLGSERMHRHIAYDKQQQGLRVKEVVPGSVFDKAGLQVGDVLISIDGTSLSSLESLIGLYRQLFYADGFTLYLQRKSVSMDLRFIIL